MLKGECNGKHTHCVEIYPRAFAAWFRAGTTAYHANTCILGQRTAWMADRRIRANDANASSLPDGSLAHPVSRTWKSSWQRANTA